MATKKHNSTFKKDSFETLFWQQNELVCGIDEVGRGCLAGPVVVAAVILPLHTSYKKLKDSKLMTKEELLESHRWIIKNCVYSWTSVDHRTIDAINIYQTTLQAMKRAVMQLFMQCPQKPKIILVDAMPLKLDNTAYQHIDVAYFNYAESKSRSIAAASILAKVERDALMHTYNKIFPGYAFDAHKGYATQRHQEAIYSQGISIIHRKSFLSKIYDRKAQSHEAQQTIC
jgi:ribonuclease HII